MKSNYKRLGDYIEEVDIRNQQGQALELWGVSIDKKFIKSVANIIGTDLSKYKIVSKNCFVCSLMQVSRDEKIPVARWDNETDAIVSPAYKVFKVKDEKSVLPKYVDLWFKRAEFDREASYYGVGGVRGSLEWEDFCDMRLPIPSIEEQQNIVDAYETIEKRIAIKKKINENLEKQAYEIYKKNIKTENKVKGRILDLASKIICGKTPSTKDEQNFIGDVPFITIPDMHNNVFSIYTERTISNKAATNIIPAYSVCVSCIASAGLVVLTDKDSQTNQQINSIVCKENISPYYVYFKMKELSDYIKHIGSCGSTTCNLSKHGFSNIEIEIPTEEIQNQISYCLAPVFEKIKGNQNEIFMLNKLRSLILTRLAS